MDLRVQICRKHTGVVLDPLYSIGCSLKMKSAIKEAHIVQMWLWLGICSTYTHTYVLYVHHKHCMQGYSYRGGVYTVNEYML